MEYGADEEALPGYRPARSAEPTRGAGEAAVSATANLEARKVELAEWEAQLHEYNTTLTEDGWKVYRKSTMSSLMNELQRRVMPDAWCEEVQRCTERVASLEAAVDRGLLKERSLVQTVQLLKTGPGCAAELQVEVDSLKSQLNWEQVKHKQRHVMAEMTQKISATGGLSLRRSLDAGAAVPDGLSLEQRVSQAEMRREIETLKEELESSGAAADLKRTALEEELETERLAHRNATETLRTVHLDAGVHEATEMAQLRMENVALTEDLDFLRKREDEVQAESARLQLVAEMNKRLGASVSKFELDALRTQLESLQTEASRVQEANQGLQAELRDRATTVSKAEGLQAEVRAFQATNDALETELVRRAGHTEELKAKLVESRARISILETQLLTIGTRFAEISTNGPPAGGSSGALDGGGGYRSTLAGANPAEKRPSVGGAGGNAPAGRRGGMPLLWADGLEVARESTSRSSPSRLRHRSSLVDSANDYAGSSPPHGSLGGAGGGGLGGGVGGGLGMAGTGLAAGGARTERAVLYIYIYIYICIYISPGSRGTQ